MYKILIVLYGDLYSVKGEILMLYRLGTVLIHGIARRTEIDQLVTFKHDLTADNGYMSVIYSVDLSVSRPAAVLDVHTEHLLLCADGEYLTVKVNRQSSAEMRKVIKSVTLSRLIIGSEQDLSVTLFGVGVYSYEQPSCHFKSAVDVSNICYAFRHRVTPKSICSLEYTV